MVRPIRRSRLHPPVGQLRLRSTAARCQPNATDASRPRTCQPSIHVLAADISSGRPGSSTHSGKRTSNPKSTQIRLMAAHKMATAGVSADAMLKPAQTQNHHRTRDAPVVRSGGITWTGHEYTPRTGNQGHSEREPYPSARVSF